FEVAAHVLVLGEARLLRYEADTDAVGGAGRAEEVLVGQGHDAQQAALARAVGANDANLCARGEGQPDVFQDLPLALDLGEVLDGENVLFRHEAPLLLRWVSSRKIPHCQVSGAWRRRQTERPVW